MCIRDRFYIFIEENRAVTSETIWTHIRKKLHFVKLVVQGKISGKRPRGSCLNNWVDYIKLLTRLNAQSHPGSRILKGLGDIDDNNIVIDVSRRVAGPLNNYTSCFVWELQLICFFRYHTHFEICLTRI